MRTAGWGFFFIWAISALTSRAQDGGPLDSLAANPVGAGPAFDLVFEKGKAFNHPSFVFWIEDLQGNYIQTLFVTKSVGTSIFRYAEQVNGQWKPGVLRRPAALPYWAHQRNQPAPDGLMVPAPSKPVPDAYTGATPQGSFHLVARADKALPPGPFRLMMEINQTWDWNETWTNERFGNDVNYQSSAQPALVYAVTIRPGENPAEWYLNPIGHSHPSGTNGTLFTDLSGHSTALLIASKIKVTLKP